MKIYIFILIFINSLCFSAYSSEEINLDCTCKNVLWKKDNVIQVNDCGNPPHKENHTLILDKDFAYMVYGTHAFFFKKLENNIITAEGLDMTENKIMDGIFTSITINRKNGDMTRIFKSERDDVFELYNCLKKSELF